MINSNTVPLVSVNASMPSYPSQVVLSTKILNIYTHLIERVNYLRKFISQLKTDLHLYIYPFNSLIRNIHILLLVRRTTRTITSLVIVSYRYF